MSDSEKNFALRQGHGIASEDGYFEARPQIDSMDLRKVFGAGFERGWEAALAAAPAQERIQALELEVRQLTEQAAGLRGGVVEILFEHEDGRYAVNPDTTGDPAWRRLGPVDVSAIRFQQPAQSAAPECLTCNDHGAVGNILTAEPCPDCSPTPQADSQPAQVLVYPPLPEPFIGVKNQPWVGHAEVIRSAIGEDGVIPCFTAGQMVAYADATHAARAQADSVLEDADPLQGAANWLAWLAQAHGQFCVAVLQDRLMIGYNRAKRLHDASIAARKQGGA